MSDRLMRALINQLALFYCLQRKRSLAANTTPQSHSQISNNKNSRRKKTETGEKVLRADFKQSLLQTCFYRFTPGQRPLQGYHVILQNTLQNVSGRSTKMPHDCPTLAPPPPPPPPLMKTQKKSTDSHQQSSIDEDYDNIRRRVRCFDKDMTPFITIYHSMEPILQKGPQCGLVALGMISALTEQRIPIEEIVQIAREQRYTNVGEMFSVDDMAKLAKAVLPPCEVHVIKGMTDVKEAVLQQLSFGALLLVPYDSDCNNEPCCKRGHKAHWAVVCGAMIYGNQQCMVFARQGKSRHVSIWNYDLLAQSNENLVQLDPSRREDGNDYLLPPGGVQEGLCGRFVLIKGLPKLVKPLIIL